MTCIVQLVPRLPPLACGIGDYATILSAAWRQQGQISRFIVAHPDWKAQPGIDALPFGRQDKDSLASLWPECQSDRLLLHYSGYGYARRGAPVWLAKSLEHFRRTHPGARIVSMIHELYAFGPPTTSAFWLSWLQRRVTAQIARLSDAVATNRLASGAWLERHAPAHTGKVKILPVFSNLGEDADAPPPSQRANHLVLFGYQTELWDAGFEGLRGMLGGLKPEVVTILGRNAEIPAEIFGATEVRRTGWLAPAAVSAILRTARFGLISYNPAFLGKSGIFAAFVAHGVVPVLVEGGKPLSEGLERGVHLLTVPGLQNRLPADSELDAMSSAGREWYRPHNIASTAATFASVLAA